MCESYNKFLAKVSYSFSLTPITAYFSVKKKKKVKSFLQSEQQQMKHFSFLGKLIKAKTKLGLKKMHQEQNPAPIIYVGV